MKTDSGCRIYWIGDRKYNCPKLKGRRTCNVPRADEDRSVVYSSSGRCKECVEFLWESQRNEIGQRCLAMRMWIRITKFVCAVAAEMSVVSCAMQSIETSSFGDLRGLA